jgi:bacterioferritin
MKGNANVIELLNDVLTAELTALNQYFVHAKMAENWGYERLWKKFRDESIDEMKDADKLIGRILFLEGVPNLQKLNKVSVGQPVKEQLELDLEVEKAAIERLNAGIETSRSLGDNGTREMLEDILVGEEEHANWLEAQLSLIAQVGEGNYLAQQMKKDG